MKSASFLAYLTEPRWASTPWLELGWVPASDGDARCGTSLRVPDIDRSSTIGYYVVDVVSSSAVVGSHRLHYGVGFSDAPCGRLVCQPDPVALLGCRHCLVPPISGCCPSSDQGWNWPRCSPGPCAANNTDSRRWGRRLGASASCQSKCPAGCCLLHGEHFGMAFHSKLPHGRLSTHPWNPIGQVVARGCWQRRTW